MQENPFQAVQRAGAFVHLASVIRQHGGVPADVASGLGIDLDALALDDLLPFGACLTLLERAAAQTGCAHVGLMMGSLYRWSRHGMIYRLSKEAPTLGDALQDFVNWQLGYTSGAAVYLHRAGPDFILGYGIYDRASRGGLQLYDAVLAIGCNMLQELTQGRVVPLEVCLCRSGPDHGGLYRRTFGAPVRFNQNQYGLIISGRDLEFRIPDADRSRREQAMAEITARMGIVTGTVTARIRHLVRPQLLRGDPSMAGMARLLGFEPRTLRRRLAAEGAVFDTIRDEVRFNAARELLALTALPVGDIADALAYANPSAFAEAFRRWSGTSATAWRKANAAHRECGDAAC